ncbi:N-alpha-acetyltransferase auxiliary subunit [Raphidocelis subcapitata]|uniref:N-alpha-acetyltransferase auxiliary subunit n=1 Tax=Raphidocelis subcapitata TaxID=307507 RepID=A0A2V0PDF9_9CHLO|nr:N-alpha-acetyltransferase auxiliary subunit [Raphidocelis subcapitata]|eukprot:GBF95135.1 N-alpha-acetyltransferase auxiliary subunit [Raphidocelis subcapitata]
MSATGNQPLPSKEQQLFRSLVRLYESKQYKKAVKAADQILKKLPEHGETLAMKGLTLKYMGDDKKEEAYDLARRGLRADLKSHVCWHVYGLLYRSDANYPEAIKCYLNALRLEKENAQILRDLAMLQIQMRDIPGFVETRHKLLTQKPSNRANWIAFAVGHHLEGNHDLAVQILTAYESTLEEIPASEAYEHSELLLYKAAVLREGGQARAALDLLQGQRARIRDRLSAAGEEAGLQLELGNAAEAERMYRELLATNPDNYRTHDGLRAALGLSPGDGGALTAAQREGLRELYAGLAAQYPRSAAVARIPLDFGEGEAFSAAADSFCRRYILRGIPSLFSALRPLYGDASKVQLIDKLFADYEAALRGPTAALPPRLDGGADDAPPSARAADGGANGNGNGNGNGGAAAAGDEPSGGAGAAAAAGAAAPATNGVAGLRPIDLSEAQQRADDQERDPLTWVLHFRSQHASWLGDAEGAVAASDEALARGPDIVDLHSARAAILGAAGDAEGAVHWAESARQRDLGDRYLNSLAVEALLAAGHTERAEKTAMLFTRDGDQVNNLFDMQHMWYECAAGEAALAAGAHGPALKSLTAVAKHFSDIAEDQFDFHSYCVRKMTLRAYVALLRLEDGLHGHGFFVRAAWGAVQAYVQLHDRRQSGQSGDDADDPGLSGLSAEERRREKQRRKKEEKKAAKEAADRAAAEDARRAAEREASSSGGGAKDGKSAKKRASKPADPDPQGAKLAATEDPLGEATKLVLKLRAHAPGDLRTQLAAFEVYLRKGRPLLALGAARRAAAIAGGDDGDVHRAVVRLALAVEQQPPASEAIAGVVREGLSELLAGAPSAAAAAERYFSAHGGPASPLPRRAAAAEMLARVDPVARPKAVAALLAGGASGAGTGALRRRLAAAAAPGRQPAGAAAPAAACEAAAAHDDCIDVQRLLAPGGALADAAAAARWRAVCAEAFPRSSHFGGAKRWVGGDGGGANGVGDKLAELAV